VTGGNRWLLGAGIALPAVLLVGFILYSQIAQRTARPPAHDALFSVFSTREPDGPNLNFSVEGERVVVHGSILPEGARWTQVLYRFRHETMTAERVTLSVPADLDGRPRVVSPPELAELPVSAERVAPDGYRFRTGFDRGPGLIGDLFGPRRRDEITIEKLGVVHRLELPAGAGSSASAQFLGWVLE
jgi:hypothetical protein